MSPYSDAEQAALDRLLEAYYARHGAAIDLVKAEVGDGDLYENSMARVVISGRGAWCECIDLPVEFSGVVGAAVHHRLVGDADAIELARCLAGFAVDAAGDRPGLSDIFAVYSAAGLLDGQDVFFWRAAREDDSSDRARTLGEFRPDILPLFMRARLTGAAQVAGVAMRRGVVVFLADVGDLHLVVEMPHEGDIVHDLAAGPRSSSAH